MATPKHLTHLCCLLLLTLGACGDDGGGEGTATLSTATLSSATLDATSGDGDGDGDPTGDGDGEPTGDGDGDPTGGDDSYCLHQCSADADCMVGGQDVGLTCVDSFCTSDASQCSGNEECVALFSGWVSPCTAGGGECEAAMQICVMSGGGGLCATGPNQFIDCATLQMEEIQTTDIDGNPVTVCGRPTAECNADSYCFLPCVDDASCASQAYPHCNVGTGLCECGQDSDCATLGQPNSSVCNAGVCGCGSDQDCVDGNVGDVCTNAGFCGCTSDMACEGVANSFDGGMISCVMP